MLYLKNALGGLGRSVTDTARHAFAHAGSAVRWRKVALYAAMFALPGGSVVVLLAMWAERRRARRTAAEQAATANAVAPACCGAQLACRAACAPSRTVRASAASAALDALRRWRRNDA